MIDQKDVPLLSVMTAIIIGAGLASRRITWVSSRTILHAYEEAEDIFKLVQKKAKINIPERL